MVVGDALLDRDVSGRVERLCPDAPVPVVDETGRASRPGGAALAAALAAADGARDVVLVAGLGADGPGRELAGLLAEAGVGLVDLGLAGPTPEKIRVRAEGRSLLRLDRHCGAPPGVGPAGDAAQSVLRSASAVLVADYGMGVAAEPSVRAALTALDRRVPVVWDPHPRGAEPVPECRLVTPNRAEARTFCPDVDGDDLAACTARARARGSWPRPGWG